MLRIPLHARAILLLYISSFATGGLAFITNVILARELEPTDYGTFVVILATIMLVSSFATAGIPHFWLRVFGREGHSALRWLKTSLYTVSVSTIFIALALLCWAHWGPHNVAFQQLFYWLFLPILVGQVLFELVTAKLQLEENYSFLGIWQLLLNSLRLFWVLIFFTLFWDAYTLENLFIGISGCSIVVVIVGVFSLRGMLTSRFKLKGHTNSKSYQWGCTPSISNVLSESYLFALAGFFYVIYFQSDIILLKYLDSPESAGIYNIAFIMLGAIYLFPSILYQRFLLPKLHRWAVHDKAKLLRVHHLGNYIMLLTGMCIMAVVLVVAPIIIPKVFGSAYDGAVPLLMILAFCIPCRFLSSSIESLFVDQSNMKRKVKSMGATALINVVLNIIAIPIWGGVGAAGATVCSEIILLILFYMTARKHVYM